MTMTFDGTSAQPLPLRINIAATGDTTLIAAVPTARIKVYGLRLSAAGPVVVSLKTGSTIREVFNLGAAGARDLKLRQVPYTSTATNEALVLSLSAAVQVDGVIEYAQGS